MARIVLLLGALAAAACGKPRIISRIVDAPPPRTEAEQRKFDAAVERGAVLIGMTKSEVRKARGNPVKKDIVEKYGGNVRRWMYSFDEVYFDANEVVVGTQAAYR